jgi:hypothetical protein
MKFVIRLVSALIIGWSATVYAADPPKDRLIDDFYGEYAGRSLTHAGKGVTPRDINVNIKGARRGFSVEWKTGSTRADGTVKRKSYFIEFRKTKRKNIYQSAMKKDVFGKLRPMDPMRGNPYVWARIHGNTLSVYAMHIIEDGTYEMQVYHRTLTESGMDLKFSRYREGESLKDITGSARKINK